VRIWFQKHTVVGRSPWLDDCYVRHARAAVGESAQVEFFGLPAETYQGRLPADYVRYGQLEVFFSWYFAERALEAERSGYAAYVIGTSQDPGLAAARSLVAIPVVGYGETTFGFLRSQGMRFGVIGFVPALEEILRQNLCEHGCARLCAGFEYVPRPLVEGGLADGDAGALMPAIEEAAARLRNRGAQAIVPGEGIPNELLWSAGVRHVAGLPFIDANGLAMATAQLHAATRERGMWSRTAPGYHTARAPADVVERMRGIFGPAVVSPARSPDEGHHAAGSQE
jgi:allantoin racemase